MKEQTLENSEMDREHAELMLLMLASRIPVEAFHKAAEEFWRENFSNGTSQQRRECVGQTMRGVNRLLRGWDSE